MTPAIAAFPRSIFRRFANGALLFTLGLIALLMAMTLGIVGDAMHRSLEATVNTDLAGLADIYASGGEDELRARLTDRQELVSQEGRRSHYLLSDAAGRRLAGDQMVMPDLQPELSEQGYVTLAGDRRAFARVTALAPTLNLMVAREYDQDRALLWRLGWSFLAAAILILLLAYWFTRRKAGELHRRIVRISDTLRRTDDQARWDTLAQDEQPDEIGELTRSALLVLRRLDNLAKTHRHMSDNIAHEIRTPLLHLDTRLRNAMTQATPDPADPVFEAARSDIRRITSLLDSLLDIAASEARKGDLVGLPQIDLSGLASNVADIYLGSFEDQGVTLTTAIAAGVAMAGEEMQVIRMLSNLLDNAVKYVPAGGTVMLDVAAGPTIVVSDDGPGIDPAIQPQLFERFRRGPGHQNGSGHGLGLALVKAICERHGLTITLDPAGPGARFVIVPEEAV